MSLNITGSIASVTDAPVADAPVAGADAGAPVADAPVAGADAGAPVAGADTGAPVTDAGADMMVTTTVVFLPQELRKCVPILSSIYIYSIYLDVHFFFIMKLTTNPYNISTVLNMHL
jgi:hypothetical protein